MKGLPIVLRTEAGESVTHEHLYEYLPATREGLPGELVAAGRIGTAPNEKPLRRFLLRGYVEGVGLVYVESNHL